MHELGTFLKDLHSETWAIVYAYNSPKNSLNLWYDRWRYDVINDYVEATSKLGVEPYIIEIDNYLRMTRSEMKQFDFIINLNSGATPVSNIGTVQSIAEWHQIPSFPNTADAVMVGERKDVCLPFFRNWFRTPQEIKSGIGSTADFKLIMKPKTMGNSRGIRIIEIGDTIPSEYSPSAHLLEEFIPGFEVSVPVVFDPIAGKYLPMPPVVYFPETEDPTNWFLSESAKLSQHTDYGRQLGEMTSELVNSLVGASEAFGFTDLARFDFRWKTATPNAGPIDVRDLYFIEINCLPTLNRHVNFLLSTRKYIQHSDSPFARHALACGSEDTAPLLYLLLNSRYRSLKTK